MIKHLCLTFVCVWLLWSFIYLLFIYCGACCFNLNVEAPNIWNNMSERRFGELDISPFKIHHCYEIFPIFIQLSLPSSHEMEFSDQSFCDLRFLLPPQTVRTQPILGYSLILLINYVNQGYLNFKVLWTTEPFNVTLCRNDLCFKVKLVFFYWNHIFSKFY